MQQRKGLVYKSKGMEHEQQEEKEKEDREINRLLFGIMEGYSDSVIPPLTQLSPLHEAAAIGVKASGSRKRGRPKETKQGIITETMQKERGRREKMTDNYVALQSMVPHLFPKATREKIVSEAIAYIKSLKKEIKGLEQLKNSSESMVRKGKMPVCSNRKSTINVTVTSNVSIFGIQTSVRQSLVPDIFKVFHKHRAEVLAANVAVNDGQLTLTVTALVIDYNSVEKIKKDILIL